MADRLKPEHFTVEAHQNIYKVAMRLHGEGREPSPVTISAALGNQEARPYMGSLAFRFKEAQDDGLNHSIQALATEVIDLANRRAILDASDKLRALAASSPEVCSTPELFARLESIITTTPTTLQKPIKTVGDLAMETFAAAERIFETGITPGIMSGFEPYDSLVGNMMPGDLIVVGGATSMGKGQPLTSRVYTREGWVSMGDVKVGMELASVDGRPSFVTGIYPQGERDVYEFTFRDGRKVRCDDSHLWKVYDHRGGWRVMSTTDLRDRVSKKSNVGRFYVPMFEGNWGHEDQLPVDPYVLGALIGDGGLTNGSIRISTVDQPILDEIMARLGGEFHLTKCGKCDYRIVTPRGQPNKLLAAIKELNLHGCGSHQKFIPDIYMSASVESRLALLRGLLDTDGHFCNTIEYSTSSDTLAHQVIELAQSLGASCHLSSRIPKYTHKGEKLNGLRSYRVHIRHSKPWLLFGLHRHSERAKQRGKALGKLAIMSIKLVGKEPTQCIKVSHPDELYVTDGFIVTHNTALAQQVAFECASKCKVLVCSMEMSARQWNDRYINQITGIPVETLESGPFDEKHFELIDAAWRRVLQHLDLVIIDQKGMTPATIMANARRVKRRFGLDLMVLDHLQFIRPNNPKKEGPEAIAETVADLKSMADSLGVPVILVSHLNRDTNKRDNYRPQMADLFGSSAIEKDADVVMFVHRLAYWMERAGPPKGTDQLAWELEIDKIRSEAELILAKRRRGRGSGIVKCGWDGNKTMFYPT